ncbi:MAG: type II secretion system protein [Candidatus Uhrbacteria bacterium]
MRQRKGFTLIELLVVIAIIGLLATLAVIAVSSARVKARDARRVSDIKQIQSALDLYATDKSGYPHLGIDSALELGTGEATCIDSSVNGFVGTCTSGELVYMSRVPMNPAPGGQNYEYAAKNTDGTACSTANVCNDYRIDFILEGPTAELRDTTGDGTILCAATSSGITCD